MDKNYIYMLKKPVFWEKKNKMLINFWTSKLKNVIIKLRNPY